MTFVHTNEPLWLQVQLPCAGSISVSLSDAPGPVQTFAGVGVSPTPVLVIGPQPRVLAGDTIAIVHAAEPLYLSAAFAVVSWKPLDLVPTFATPPYYEFTVTQYDATGAPLRRGMFIDASRPFFLTHSDRWLSQTAGGILPAKLILGAPLCGVDSQRVQVTVTPAVGLTQQAWWSGATGGRIPIQVPLFPCGREGWVQCTNGQCMPNANACFPYAPRPFPGPYKCLPGEQLCPNGKCQHAGTRCITTPVTPCPRNKRPCPGGCC